MYKADDDNSNKFNRRKTKKRGGKNPKNDNAFQLPPLSQSYKAFFISKLYIIYTVILLNCVKAILLDFPISVLVDTSFSNKQKLKLNFLVNMGDSWIEREITVTLDRSIFCL